MNNRAQSQSETHFLSNFLRKQARAGSLVYLLLPLFLYWIDEISTHPHFALASILILVNAFIRFYVAKDSRHISGNLFIKLNNLLVVTNGLCVALFAYIIFQNPILNLDSLIFYCIFVATLSGGAMVAMAALPYLAILNTSLLLSPMVLGFIFTQQIQHSWLLAATGVTILLLGFKQLSHMSGILNQLKTSVTEVQFQQQRNEVLLQQIPGLASWFNEELSYINCNDRLLSKINLQRHQLIGRKVGFQQQDSPFFTALQNFAKKGDSQQALELEIFQNGVKIPHLTLFNKYMHNGKCEYSALSFDISELKAKEKKLEEIKLLILQQEKMLAMGEMASGIAHEINNPLAIISAKAELLSLLLRKGVTDGAQLEKHLTSIVNTSLRISKVINGLKALARDSRLEDISAYSIQDILEPITDLNYSKFKNAGIALRIDIENPRTQIDCSLVGLNQVLTNLLINASDAVETLADKWVQISISETPTTVYFRITDSGPGISPEIQTKIFNPFFTTKPPGKGTGIGLPLSKELLNKMGGDLIYELHNSHTSFLISIKKPVNNTKHEAA